MGRTRTISETKFQAQVIREAEKFNWLVYHTYDSRRSRKGWPDLALCHPVRGWFCVAELKVDGNVPTLEQAAWLEALRRAGVAAYVWTELDWSDIGHVLINGPHKETKGHMRHRGGDVPCR